MRYNIMFRNGDGVTLKADSHKIDQNQLVLWNGMNLVAVFSWEAIVGFTITEEN